MKYAMRERGSVAMNCRQEMRLGTRESDRKSTSCGPNNFHPHQHKGPRACLVPLVCCSCFFRSFNNVGLVVGQVCLRFVRCSFWSVVCVCVWVSFRARSRLCRVMASAVLGVCPLSVSSSCFFASFFLNKREVSTSLGTTNYNTSSTT